MHNLQADDSTRGVVMQLFSPFAPVYHTTASEIYGQVCLSVLFWRDNNSLAVFPLPAVATQSMISYYLLIFREIWFSSQISPIRIW